MTREDAKQLLPIIQAFSEGKCIQTKTGSGWVNMENMSFAGKPKAYRIKPESKYRSFKDRKECWAEMKKHHPFGWIMCDDGCFNIVYVTDEYVGLADPDGSSISLASKNSYQDNTFVDGTPFGMKVEE